MAGMQATFPSSRYRVDTVQLVSAQAAYSAAITGQFAPLAPDPGVIYPDEVFVQGFFVQDATEDAGAGGWPTLGTQIASATLNTEHVRARAYSPNVAESVGDNARRWSSVTSASATAFVTWSFVFRRFRKTGAIANDVIDGTAATTATLRSASRSQSNVLAVSARVLLGLPGDFANLGPPAPPWTTVVQSFDGGNLIGSAVETRMFQDRGTTVQPLRSQTGLTTEATLLFHIRG